MDRNDFHPDTRYTITWRDTTGRPRAATIYVYRVYDQFMIVRPAGDDALLRKIAYPEVLRIVSAQAVAPPDRYSVPAALLEENSWRERTVLAHYSTSPARGK